MYVINDNQKEMVEEFQCPGCVCGSGVSDCYQEDDPGFFCKNHVAGTLMAGIGILNLGLPKGFNRVQLNKHRSQDSVNNIRLFEEGDLPKYDYLNVPVWVMEKEGYLFVRCYFPRVNWDFVDVIKGGKIEDVQKTHPHVYDVSEFIDSID